MREDATRLLDDDRSSLIAFWIGPAQPFIAGARSVRDLWLGSRILSWLTTRAMVPIHRFISDHGPGAFLTPAVEDHLLAEREPAQAGPTDPRLLGWPNRFVAVIKDESAGIAANRLAGES